MNLEEAVNEARNDLELVDNPRFITLMSSLYELSENHFQSESPDYHECVTDMQSAIGEFVPVERELGL